MLFILMKNENTEGNYIIVLLNNCTFIEICFAVFIIREQEFLV